MSLQTEKDTICYKINECMDEAESALKTGGFDLLKLVKNLNSIRKDAQRMEDALKLRKEMMINGGLEEAYRIKKGKANTKPGINKMPDAAKTERSYQSLHFHVRVVDKGNNDEVIYDNVVGAGVFSIAERIDEIDEQGDINGQSQQFAFGHDLSIWYAFNQLQHTMQEKGTAIMLAIRKAIEEKTFADPEKKKRLLRLMNNQV